MIPTRSLCPKPFWSGYAAADACASGNMTQIGGFIQSASGQKLWFAEQFTHSDFQFLPFSIDPAMQKSISAFETLAQIGLVWLAASFFPGFRIPICLKSLSDNTGAESVSNKMFTTTKPLYMYLFMFVLTTPQLWIKFTSLTVHHSFEFSFYGFAFWTWALHLSQLIAFHLVSV